MTTVVNKIDGNMIIGELMATYLAMENKQGDCLQSLEYILENTILDGVDHPDIRQDISISDISVPSKAGLNIVTFKISLRSDLDGEWRLLPTFQFTYDAHTGMVEESYGRNGIYRLSEALSSTSWVVSTEVR